MSEKPPPGDNFSQLKELMVGDVEEALETLRSRFDGFEAEESAERIAKELAEALRRRRSMGDEAFNAWVAALQESTEAALQRSVTRDKSRLSGILFPVMGPAIRDYTVDLFRRMAQELNETIRNATSAKRILWRFQARMAGKSYPEYVMLKTRAFRIEEVYLMQRDTGLLLLHAAANAEDGADEEADLVSGMLSAIRSFVRDSFAEINPEGGDSEELDGFTFGEREVLIEMGPKMTLAAVAHGVPPPDLRDKLKKVVEDLHSEIGDKLESFDGDMARLESSRPTLRRALIDNQAATAESGGGMWRVWLLLSLLLLGIGTWIFLGVREQNRWDRFEEALRAEPGIAVTGVEPDGFWRHRRVIGLRDPDAAATPAEIAERFEIDPEKTAFDFDLMESMDPAIADRRRAREEERERLLNEKLEALKRRVDEASSGEAVAELNARLKAALAELEGSEAERRAQAAQVENTRRVLAGMIRSQFADIEGLAIEFDESVIRFRGEVEEPVYSSLLRQIAPIAEVLSVDTSGLTSGSVGKLEALEKGIREISLLFRSGGIDREDDANVGRLVGLIAELDRVASGVGSKYRYVVEAHPLIGENREANRVIERNRLQQVRELLEGRGIDAARIDTRLSEDSTKAGGGVSVLPVRE